MSKAEKVWKKIGEVQQGTSTPESDVKQEAAEEAQLC